MPDVLIETTTEIGEQLAEDEFQAVMTIGPLSITGVLDGSGSMTIGEMEIGPVTMKMKRVYQSGEF